MTKFNAEEIIKGIRQHDKLVLQYVYITFYQFIKFFVNRNSGNDDDAEDVYQDAIIIIYKKDRGNIFTSHDPNEKQDDSPQKDSFCSNKKGKYFMDFERKKTWNDYWRWRIQLIPANRENREKYVNYIIDRRRQEGLPELVSQAEQK